MRHDVREQEVMILNCLAEERETMDWPPHLPSNAVGLCQTL
jgi:hypothetical protein